MLAAKLIQYWIRAKRSINFTLIQLNMFPEIERQSLLEVGWKNSDYEPQDFTANELKKYPEGVWDALKEGLKNWRGCTNAPHRPVVH